MVGIGTFVPNAFRAQSDVDAGREKLAFNPFLSLHYPFRLSNRFFFVPELAYAIHTGQEDNTSKQTIILSYVSAYSWTGKTLLRFGFANEITKFSGDGGSVTLNNGSSTAEFFVPEESVTTYTSSIVLGSEFLVNPKWSLRLDGHITRFLSSERRGFNYLLSINYNP